MGKKRGSPSTPGEVRIIGGLHRGRKLVYHGDADTRPMKDRTREAVFNLVGPGIKGKHAIDLFAGTGALGLEAISRGATQATLLERNFRFARVIEQNAATIDVSSQTRVIAADTFLHCFSEAFAESFPAAPPHVVFFSPPYDFYDSRNADMVQLIERFFTLSPAGSILVVEADARFDATSLPDHEEWDVRAYRPAVVAMYRKK